MRDILFARCNYAKVANRRLLTTIERDAGVKYIYKQAAHPAANEYVQQLLQQERLVTDYVGDRAEVVCGTLTEDGRLRYTFVDLPTIEYVVCEYLDRGDVEQAFITIDRVVAWIRQLEIEEADVFANPQLVSLYGDGLHLFGTPVQCLKLGLLDLNAENLLYDKAADRYYMIDHEIVVPGCLPVELTIFRFIFFTVLRLANVLDTHADLIPTRTLAGGLFRVPQAWNIERWIDEQHLEQLIALEERFQSNYTGRLTTWPRPIPEEGMIEPTRQRRNAGEQLAQLKSAVQRLRHDQTLIQQYQQELDATNRRFDAYIQATEKAVGEYQQELATRQQRIGDIQQQRDQSLNEQYLVRAEMRRSHRQIFLNSQLSYATQRWLESELSSARTHVGQLQSNLSLRPGKLAARYVRRLQAKVAHPLPKVKRRVKHLRSWLRQKMARTSASPGTIAVAPEQAAYITFSAAESTPWQGALFSIILPRHLIDQAQQDTIIALLKRQTFQSFECIVWDASAYLAWDVDQPQQPWRVAHAIDLAPTLTGKYAIVATSALEALPLNYFEVNALTLEGEGLDVAINSFDAQGQALAAFQQGLLPGTSTNEWMLVVSRAEALDEQLTFSLDRIPRRPYSAHVAGRLLMHHPIAALASASDWSRSMASTQWRLTTQEHYLLVRSDTQSDWGQVPHVLHPIDSVVRRTSATAERPRALVLFPFIAVGGAEQLTLDVLTRLKERFELLIVTVEPKDPSIGTMVGEYQQLTPHVYILPEFLPHHLNFSALCYLIDGYGVETLFVANGAGWIYDAAASLRQRFPHLHMVNQVYDHRIGWIDRYDKTLVRVFDRHIAPNQSIVKAYQDRGVLADAIDLIYHGIDTAAFDPAHYDHARIATLRSAIGLPPDKPVIAFLARMHPQKRPADFLLLAQRFRPTEASFLLVGDGPLAEQIEHQIKRVHMPHLYRLPFYKPFVDILAVADIVVIPSEYEGLPLVLLNAQAMGKPVVATDVGAIREVLEFTKGGIVVERIGDVAALERGVRAMLAGQPDRAGVRERIRERFDIEHVAALYGDSLQKTCHH